MKHEVGVDDGDLEYISARLKELLETVDKLRLTVEKFLNISLSVKITVLGYTVATVEVKLNELKSVPAK